MSNQNLINLLENDIKKIISLIEKIKKNDREFLFRQEKGIVNLKSNQDLIDQLNDNIVRVDGLITDDQTAITNINDAISSYQDTITALNNEITDIEADIADLEQQNVNFNLIIAFIPPDV